MIGSVGGLELCTREDRFDGRRKIMVVNARPEENWHVIRGLVLSQNAVDVALDLLF